MPFFFPHLFVKLAFLVDCTSAPVASISLVSSYMAVETRLIAEQFANFGINEDAYYVFLTNIPRNFFQIFFMFLAFCIAVTGRDTLTMYTSEKEAKNAVLEKESVEFIEDNDLQAKAIDDKDAFSEDEKTVHAQDEPREKERSFKVDFSPLKDKPQRAINAVVPLIAFIVIAIVGMFYTGYKNSISRGISQNPSFQDMLSQASTLDALLWAVFSSCVISIVLLVVQRILTLSKAFTVFAAGIASTTSAMFLLGMAFTLGDICTELQLGGFIAFGLQGNIPAGIVPFLTAILSGLAAFANGSSYGTMAIMFPIAFPLAHAVAPNDKNILYQTIASIISGAVFGDSCSPFSDIVVLSALVAGVSPISHAKTQFPYALVSFLVSLIFGDLFVGLGIYPYYIALPIGCLILLGFIFLFGKRAGIYYSKENRVGPIDEQSIFYKIFKKIFDKFGKRKNYSAI